MFLSYYVPFGHSCLCFVKVIVDVFRSLFIWSQEYYVHMVFCTITYALDWQKLWWCVQIVDYIPQIFLQIAKMCVKIFRLVDWGSTKFKLVSYYLPKWIETLFLKILSYYLWQNVQIQCDEIHFLGLAVEFRSILDLIKIHFLLWWILMANNVF